MSRVVSWGRWVVVALACALAAGGVEGIVVYCFEYANREARPGLELVLTADSIYVGAIAISLSCAWGIFKWRSWGHVLALALFGFHLLIGVLGGIPRGPGILYPLATGLVVAWLLLPSVWAAYWRGHGPQRVAA